MAERYKAKVCGRSLSGVAGSNPAGGMAVCVICVAQLGRKHRQKKNQNQKVVQMKHREQKKFDIGTRYRLDDPGIESRWT